MNLKFLGDAGVRGTAQQPRLFVGMILILIFSEVKNSFLIFSYKLNFSGLGTVRNDRGSDFGYFINLQNFQKISPSSSFLSKFHPDGIQLVFHIFHLKKYRIFLSQPFFHFLEVHGCKIKKIRYDLNYVEFWAKSNLPAILVICILSFATPLTSFFQIMMSKADIPFYRYTLNAIFLKKKRRNFSFYQIFYYATDFG